jgi:trk system potassium uptake protein
MLRRLLELPLLVLLLGLAGLTMLLPAGHAFVMRDHALARSFLYMGLLVLIFTAMLGLARANNRPRNVARNHLISLAVAYLILPPVLALPLLQRAAGGAEFGAAWFEMLSSFTTTGASVLEGSLKPTVHLWRAQVGWMGGFFALVMVFAVLAPLNLGGIEVESGRMPGRASPATQQITTVSDPSQRMARFAAILFPIYGGLTLLLWLLLMMVGEDSFVALCHAMGTLSTSGITPLAGFDDARAGWQGEALVAVFLMVALTRRPLQRALGQGADLRLWRDPEVRLAVAITLIVVVSLWLWHWSGAVAEARGDHSGEALRALWGIFFTALSFLTTTGYVSEFWGAADLWSDLPPADMVLWALAIVGGGVATTAGGVKLLRVYVLLRFGEQELDRVIHPNAVGRVRAGAAISRQAMMQGTAMAWVFFMTFGLSIAAFVAALTLVGQPFDSALLFTLSALTTTGPLVDQSGYIFADYSAVEGPARAILGFAMVVGRLETLAILAILLPEHLRN